MSDTPKTGTGGQNALVKAGSTAGAHGGNPFAKAKGDQTAKNLELDQKN